MSKLIHSSINLHGDNSVLVALLAEKERRRRRGLHVERQQREAKTRQEQEVNKCWESCAYFINNYCYIYDATQGEWLPFKLWTAQEETLEVITLEQLIIILKARQLGLTWLVLAYALWLMLFHPAATVLLFSLRDTEAVYLLSDERLKGMFSQLPEWLKVPVKKDDAHVWQLSNGSTAKAFPTSAGDSYTATLAIVDEADLVPDLNKLMRRVKPTIDGGGKMILLSRSNKSLPQSEFKRIYRAAKQRLTKWRSVFLPWSVRPERDEAWYAEQRADIMQRTGSLDDLHEQYPATDTEALAPRSLDKRIHPDWLEKCFVEVDPVESADAPAIPGLVIYRLPEKGRRYVLGVDTAEGNPTSDDSSIHVLDRDSGEECAKLSGKLQPSVTAAHADSIGKFYNKADVLVERNNHGHAVIQWLRDNGGLKVLSGGDGKFGWLDNSRGKVLLYDEAADAFRTQDTVIHSFSTFTQLSSVEGATLRAPEGEPDDEADSYALALVARTFQMVDEDEDAYSHGHREY